MNTISIVTPSYNQNQFLEETIRSVLSQEGDFFIDYIIMDGGSEDNSVEIIKRYDELLKKNEYPVKCGGIEYRWVSQKDKGQVDAINRGFQMAKGEILAWINSDDAYVDGAFKKADEYFSTHPDILLIYGDTYHVDRAGALLCVEKSVCFESPEFYDGCGIKQASVFFRRNVIEKIGWFDPSYHYTFDYDYWIRAQKSGLKTAYVPLILSLTRKHEGAKTNLSMNFCHEFFWLVTRHGSRENVRTLARRLVSENAANEKISFQESSVLLEKVLKSRLAGAIREKEIAHFCDVGLREAYFDAYAQAYAAGDKNKAEQLMKELLKVMPSEICDSRWVRLFVKSLLPAKIVDLLNK